ncbi:MAG TPA: tetratricopeptide repeat protein, partial [Dehalococcoidia bacterium]|nr:tetratricopeptide repeat protein [Dehalococcoidia bacterium]
KIHYTEGLSITRRMGDQVNTVRALGGLAEIALTKGEAHTARTLFEESLALARTLGRTLDMPFNLGDLARAEIELGNLDRADALLEEALSLDAETMAPTLRSWLHVNRGRAVRLRGSHNPADDYREALRLAGEVHRYGRSLVAECLDEVAAFAAATGHGLRAPALWGAADRQRELIGLWWRRSGDIEEAISRTREALGEQVFGQAWDAGRALSSEQAVAVGLALVDELARNASRIGVAQGR